MFKGKLCEPHAARKPQYGSASGIKLTCYVEIHITGRRQWMAA
jgi:hypothetical protein